MRPLAIDLFCGLGGWTEGLLAEGYDVIGFDTERHEYGSHRYPAQLVVQDVLTLHGSQFKDATLIVASPPCQEYSQMAMPWKRAKAKAAAIRADTTGKELERLNRLFNACLRIQLEASVAAGRHIPMVIENVKGAQPWVGRARWSFGSFYLWGDVPALMPIAMKAAKVPGLNWSRYGEPGYRGEGFNTHAARGRKTNGAPHIRAGEDHARHLTNPAEHEQCANGFADYCPGGCGAATAEATTGEPDSMSLTAQGIKQRGSGAAWWDKALDDRRKAATAIKIGGGRDGWFDGNTSPMRQHHSGSSSRKFASTMIAKIPLPLSRHIAATYRNSQVTGERTHTHASLMNQTNSPARAALSHLSTPALTAAE